MQVQMECDSVGVGADSEFKKWNKRSNLFGNGWENELYSKPHLNSHDTYPTNFDELRYWISFAMKFPTIFFSLKNFWHMLFHNLDSLAYEA